MDFVALLLPESKLASLHAMQKRVCHIQKCRILGRLLPQMPRVRCFGVNPRGVLNEPNVNGPQNLPLLHCVYEPYILHKFEGMTGCFTKSLRATTVVFAVSSGKWLRFAD